MKTSLVLGLGLLLFCFVTETWAQRGGERCGALPDRGPCYASIQRYFYNRYGRRCEVFQYGGCGGNRNNYGSIRECERACRRRT